MYNNPGMEYNLSYLTFLADPIAYQAQADDLCVRIPTEVSSAEALMTFLRESLDLPAYVGTSWYALRDALGSWYNSVVTPRCVVLIHTDLPFFQSGKWWWLDVQGYLMALIESITFLERKNAVEADPQAHRELVVLFPEQAKEGILAVFTRPPDWEWTVGFVGYDAFNIYEIAPSLSLILRHLTNLNGLTADMCILSRQDVGSITVQYARSFNAYCIKYQDTERDMPLIACSSDTLSFPPMVSLSAASQVLAAFFDNAQRSDSLNWFVLSDDVEVKLKEILRRSYYLSDEEELLELSMEDAMHTTIGEGVKVAASQSDDAFSLPYWKSILEQPEATLALRLAAICIVGRSGCQESTTLLHPFLQSTVKQERWVCARFFGLWGDEEALPILLSMLIDELPTDERSLQIDQDGYWYDAWRPYAPRLLRKWLSPAVCDQLRQALDVWKEAEPLLDPEYEVWRSTVREIARTLQSC
ncbi:HEAT repeat domain-containing protein [Dictyobacter aurantiacus]|uniref:Uncharacterized protein n=1 Tax=Dictyobacter aurantiacus TaxID=1936993 RepID=A0A401Z8C3_9CHLR|nr:hypothetical protein [Dictyobacter aurantiacus]GCE03092.1 hypothetical protein KDAU_04210 [Dictyobacter aurantiacus]